MKEKYHDLVDKFGRKHDYLRISLTDKCNFRCTYCMPEENMLFTPQHKLMSADEIFSLAEIFVKCGIKKIRLTGGEPLMRKDFDEIVARLSKLNVELTLTTNAYLIDRHISTLKKKGIKKVNASLDTLQAQRFENIVQRNHFDKVKENIDLLLQDDFIVKVNVVLIKDKNQDEILDFVAWTKNTPVHIRFIEFMPFNGNHWDLSHIVGYKEILTTISQKFTFQAEQGKLNDTARVFKLDGAKGSFGIISTITNDFCSGCNRIRLTADGKIKNCLFSREEMDILTPLRNGDDVVEIISQCVERKHFKHAGLKPFSDKQATKDYNKNRSMIKIGG